MMMIIDMANNDSKKNISVRDIMRKSVMTLDSSATVNEAAKMMKDAKIGSVIIYENNVPVGIITNRDFVIKVAAEAYPITDKIKTVMSSPLMFINPDETVRMAADIMYSCKLQKLPVIENNQIVGIITASDIVNQLAICTEDDIRDMYCHSLSKIYHNTSPYI